MNDFQNYLINEFVEDYRDGYMPRRELLKRVLYITGGVASAASVLALLGCGGSAAPASSGPGSSAAGSPAGGSSSARPAGSGAAAQAPASGAAGGSSAKPAGGSSAKPAGSGAAAQASASGAAGGSSAKPAGSGAAAQAPASGAAGASSAKPAAPTPTGARSPVSVTASDPAVEARDVSFQGAGGATLLGYEARPRNAGGELPLVLLITMNVGLEDHMRDVTRRYAKEGYLAMTLDPISREGGTSKVERARVGALMSQTSPDTYVGDYKAALDFYGKQPGIRMDRIGMSGFCIGGTLTYRSIIGIPEIRAAAPYYGSAPPLDQVKNIKAAIWGVYSADPNDNANRDQDKLDQALNDANVVHTFKTYPGTQHAFHDDTGPRYLQEQALAAWKDTLDWFGKYLKG